MNINEHLFEVTKPYLVAYDCDRNDIKIFLECQDPIKRQRIAINVIESIMEPHKKGKFNLYISDLANVELGTRNLKDSIRDHVNHALLSFIVGIYINENILRSLGCHVDEFEWKIAALFHDVGYPLQIASTGIINPFVSTVNKINKTVSNGDKKPLVAIHTDEIVKLTDDKNGIELIQERIAKWGLKINAKSEYDKMKSEGVCHGIISSLVLLQMIDLMYNENNPNREFKDIPNSNIPNWNQKYFDKNVVSACGAIYLHNLPNSSFNQTKINLIKSPVAFLLKLSDTLQDWDRPSAKYLDGYLSTDFEMYIKNNRIYYTAPLSRIGDIEKDIKSSLVEYEKFIEFKE